MDCVYKDPGKPQSMTFLSKSVSLSLWIDHTTRDDDTSYRMPLRSLINLSTDGLPT